MKIHALGPNGTDSEEVAHYWSRRANIDAPVQLWSSYVDIFNSLRNLVGDYLVVPVGYLDAQDGSAWVDLHFGAYGQVELLEVFARPTKPMVVLERAASPRVAIALAPATRGFLRVLEFLPGDIPQNLVASKPLALQKLLSGGASHCICSLPDWDPQEWERRGVEIVERLQPDMVWSVYRVT